jgi:hypothetical protein
MRPIRSASVLRKAASQRDSDTKPRVARNEKPWGKGNNEDNPERVATPSATLVTNTPSPKPKREPAAARALLNMLKSRIIPFFVYFVYFVVNPFLT